MAESMHLGHINVTMTAIADGAGVSSAAVREHITGEYLAQHRAGDSPGRRGEARNV